MKKGWGEVIHLVIVRQVERVPYLYFPELRLWVEGGILYSDKIREWKIQSFLNKFYI